MAPQTHLAPFLTGSTEYGHDWKAPQSHAAPFLQTGVTFAPAGLRGTSEGLVVKVGSTVLTDVMSPSWMDELGGAGHFDFRLENDDPDMPDFDDIVSFVLDGVLRFAGPIRGKGVVEIGAGEEADEVTSISGPGRLAITEKSVIPPARGWDAEPVEVTTSDSWVSFDYDASAWPRVKRIRRADVPSVFFPRRSTPEWWPDKTAYWVAPNRSDITGLHAPVGAWPIRSDPITLAAGTIAVLSGFNNQGALFLVGAQIAEVANSPGDGNRVDIDVSAGDYVLAARITNFIRDTGFIASIYSVDDDGLLDTLLWSSDSDNMRALPYPSPFPGTNAGISIRKRHEAIQAEGELLDMRRDFTDFVDSAGQPWTTVPEITTDVGRKFYEYLGELSDWLIDVHMPPGGEVLRAWNWGTRGTTRGTIAATTNRLTSEVPALSFDGVHPRANRLRIRYRYGYTVVDLSGSDPTVTDFLDLSHIRDEATAQQIGTNLLELRKDPSWAGTIVLDPVSSQPYEDFDNGDTVGHPADPNGVTSSRVRSMSYSEDDNAERLWTVEINDIRLENEARQDNWLKRVAMGSLVGGARVTSRRGDAIPAAEKVAAKTVREFSFQDPVDGAITAWSAAESTGNLIEFHVDVTTEDGTPTSSASEVRVWLGATDLGTCTVPAGDEEADFDLDARKVYRNVSRLRAEVVTVGGGVNGITVQVRAI